MRTLFILMHHLFVTVALLAQTYPDLEFSNEIYLMKKGDSVSLVRLEKNIANLETKMKLGGFGGVENGFEIDGPNSKVRIGTADHFSFVISKGNQPGRNTSAQADSIMLANGMDPSMSPDMMGGMDHPAEAYTLYKLESEKGKRKVYMQKVAGAFSFSSKKIKSSEQYPFSVKQIREGYWEYITDKVLPPGEYAFSKMNLAGSGSANMSYLLFAFGVD